jgi:uncharacterized membrane protein YciS (DUF1049 family)
MRAVRAVLVLVLILLLVAFLYNNHFGVDQKVDVRLEPLMANRVGVPLVTVVFWAFAGGAVLSMLLFVSIYVKQSVQAHTNKRRIKALESEVAILRNRPIEESAELLKGADRKHTDLRSPFADG